MVILIQAMMDRIIHLLFKTHTTRNGLRSSWYLRSVCTSGRFTYMNSLSTALDAYATSDLAELILQQTEKEKRY